MRLLLFSLLIFSYTNTFAFDLNQYLLPKPKELILKQGSLSRSNGNVIIKSAAPQLTQTLLKVLNNFKANGIEAHLAPALFTYDTPLLLADINPNLQQQAYTLTISKEAINLQGGSDIGLYYGLLTLHQIGNYANEAGYWPVLSIFDEPDFVRRGVMLDISRDKVPTMETLYALIDKLASWKINEIQLYTEHTFAYKNHETVWKDASPITAQEVRLLDAYCQDRFIDLVPNQNSFGHMKRWLKHKEYEHLAELPQPGRTIWGMMSRTSLSPVEPGSLELMKELYAELLPNFSSQYFNIGCDETVELGVGKSKALCREKGKGRVYLDFVLSLKKEVDKYGRTTQFWGDIILHHPELIPELPQDLVALIWGYDANYPFDKNCHKFKKAGLSYYVCPGTSTWNSIIGRNHNGFANLRNAAINGKKHDATGFLNTNWGDQGHWQPLTVCYPTLLYGAALSWQVDANTELNISDAIALHVFNDKSGSSGSALLNIGNAYLSMKAPCDNSSIFHQILKRNARSVKTDRWLKSLRTSNVDQTVALLNKELEHFIKTPINCADSTIIKMELEQATRLALHSCAVAKAKLNTTDGHFNSIPASKQQALKEELQNLIASHQTIWLMRNRQGGLSDSAGKMAAVLKSYR